MRVLTLLCVVLFARLAAAQEPDATRGASGTTVSGVVYDSLARAPLAGAVVQLVIADSLARFGRSAISDSRGRFTLVDVPAGRYMLGFLHPLLDSLGVEPLLRVVHVDGRRAVSADLAIPSAARLRAAICGTQSATPTGGVVVGIVRDARDRIAAAGVTVIGEWLDISFTPRGIVPRTPRLSSTTGENGWFALCNVPSAGTMTLIASRGEDSTDLIEVQIPAEGFLRRELSLGSARTVVTADTTPRADTIAPPPTRRRGGDGRVSGTVVAAVGDKPLAGALVSITDGPQSLANERGEWTITGAPSGTRMLEVRAVGYYPERIAVDVVAGAAPIRTALSTMKAVLDTVTVRASRLNDMSGFSARRRSGVGRYLTPEDIARRQPVFTSDVFRTVPGLHMGSDSLRDTQILMRGGADLCSPAIYLDGHYMARLSAEDINAWVKPDEVAGIEVYTSAVPPQYQRALSGCGSILIWTRLRALDPDRGPLKLRVVKAVGVAAIALLIGALLGR